MLRRVALRLGPCGPDALAFSPVLHAARGSVASERSVRIGLGAAGLVLALGVGGVAGARLYKPEGRSAAKAVRMASLDQALPWKAAVRAGLRDADRLRGELNAVRGEIQAIRNAAHDRQSDGQRQAQELRALRVTLEQQKSDTASLRADILARAERAERDGTQRSDKLSERLDRLDRRLADHTATASLAKNAPEPAKAERQTVERQGLERQGLERQALDKPANADKAVRGYVLRDVARGVALIETSRGVFDVIPGDMVPGAGRVLSIERHAGRWRVVTSNGVIDDRID